jgi:hypothetical protein
MPQLARIVTHCQLQRRAHYYQPGRKAETEQVREGSARPQCRICAIHRHGPGGIGSSRLSPDGIPGRQGRQSAEHGLQAIPDSYAPASRCTCPNVGEAQMFRQSVARTGLSPLLYKSRATAIEVGSRNIHSDSSLFSFLRVIARWDAVLFVGFCFETSRFH